MVPAPLGIADYALGSESTVLKESREVPEEGLLGEALLVKPSLVSYFAKCFSVSSLRNSINTSTMPRPCIHCSLIESSPCSAITRETKRNEPALALNGPQWSMASVDPRLLQDLVQVSLTTRVLAQSSS